MVTIEQWQAIIIYLITLRQIFEVEAKLRMQNFLPLKLNSSAFGEVTVNNSFDRACDVDDKDVPINCRVDFDIDVLEDDLEGIEDYLCFNILGRILRSCSPA